MKNLQNAEVELAQETTIAGGRMHAWKNLLHRVAQKARKPLAAFTAAGLTLGLLSGCMGAGITKIDPDEYDYPTENPTAVCSTLTEDQIAGMGDVIPVEEIKDSFGTYCKVAINPKSGVFNIDDSKIDYAALEALGYTKEDAQNAVNYTVEYVVDVLSDSLILDSPDISTKEWYEQNKDKFTPEFHNWIEKNPETPFLNISGGGLSYEVTQNYLAREGQSRVNNLNIEVTGVTAYPATVTERGYKTSDTIEVSLSYTTRYNASDQSIVSMISSLGNHKSSDVQYTYPSFADGLDDNILITTNQLELNLAPSDGKFKIDGNSWNIRMTVENSKLEELQIASTK